jgi:hypothetical protein
MIEVMGFRLRADIGDEEFEAADRRVQTDVAYLQDGLIRRTTARSDDGKWIVIEIWHSEDSADAAAADRRGQPQYADYLSLIDASSIRTDRYATLG